MPKNGHSRPRQGRLCTMPPPADWQGAVVEIARALLFPAANSVVPGRDSAKSHIPAKPRQMIASPCKPPGFHLDQTHGRGRKFPWFSDERRIWRTPRASNLTHTWQPTFIKDWRFGRLGAIERIACSTLAADVYQKAAEESGDRTPTISPASASSLPPGPPRWEEPPRQSHRTDWRNVKRWQVPCWQTRPPCRWRRLAATEFRSRKSYRSSSAERRFDFR